MFDHIHVNACPKTSILIRKSKFVNNVLHEHNNKRDCKNLCQFGNLQATISYVFIYQVSSGLRLPRGPCLGMSCPSEGLVTQANDHLPRRSQI